MVKKRKNKDIFQFILLTGIVVLLNIISSLEFFRIDLTSEKRYSLSDATIDLLESYDDIIYVKIYLEGDFPSGFQRLQRETEQMLGEFRAYNRQIEYEFIDPNGAEDEKVNQELSQQLQFKGLRPYRLQINEGGGNRVMNIFPGAIMSYGDKEVAVPLLVDQLGSSPENQINTSVQNLEFALANGIKQLVLKRKPLVGFLEGHGELEPLTYLADFARTLAENYNINRFNIRKFRSDSTGEQLSISDQLRRINRFDAIIVAKPRRAFNNLDKYLLDQFIMGGGKVLWLLDAVHAEMDSLSKSAQFISYPVIDQLGLSDMLFRYGARVNTNLVQDMIAAGVSDQRNVYPWVYFPMVMPQVKHPITKDLNAIKLEFASTIDTIIAPGVKKTPLLLSSPYSKTVGTPHMVNLGTLYQKQEEKRYTQKYFSLAMLLEGEFESAFKNRLLPKEDGTENLPLKEKSSFTQMLVVGDGDIIKNQLNIVNPNLPRGTPLPLGFDQFTGTQYGNKDFLMNTIDYMLDETGLISIRSRELKIRLLDFNKLKEGKLNWQLLNTLLPIAVIIIFGLLFNYLRRRQYAAK